MRYRIPEGSEVLFRPVEDDGTFTIHVTGKDFEFPESADCSDVVPNNGDVYIFNIALKSNGQRNLMYVFKELVETV